VSRFRHRPHPLHSLRKLRHRGRCRGRNCATLNLREPTQATLPRPCRSFSVSVSFSLLLR